MLCLLFEPLGSCQVPGPLRERISVCNDFYSLFNEDKNNYGVGWTVANTTLNTSSNTTSNTTSNATTGTSPWVYQSMNELGGIPFLGIMGTYGGGGYSFDLSLSNLTEAFLTSLKENSWIDSRTRAIFMEIAIYSAQVNLFGVATFLTEWIPTNGVIYFNTVKVARLYSFGNDFHIVTLVCEIFLACFVVVFVYAEMKKMYKLRKGYLRDPWNWLEMAQILLILTCTGALFERTSFAQSSIEQMNSNPEKFVSFMRTITWDEVFGYSLAFLVFFANLKLLKLIRFNHRIYQFTKTLSTAAPPLMSFMIVFSIFYIAYSILFYAMFGAILPEYRSFLFTIETLFNTVMGAFDFEVIKENNRILGPIIFFSFMMIMVMILLNVFLTILMDSYAEVQEDEHLTSEDSEVVEKIIKRFKYFFLRTDKVDILAETDIASSDSPDSSSNSNLAYDHERMSSVNQPVSEASSFNFISESLLEQTQETVNEENYPLKVAQASLSSIENAGHSSETQHGNREEEQSSTWSSSLLLANEWVETEDSKPASSCPNEPFLPLSGERFETETCKEAGLPCLDEPGQSLALPEGKSSVVCSDSSIDRGTFSRRSSIVSQKDENRPCEMASEDHPPSMNSSPPDSPRSPTLSKSRRTSSSGYCSSSIATENTTGATEVTDDSNVSRYYDLLDKALDSLTADEQDMFQANNESSESVEQEVSYYYSLLERATKELDQDNEDGANASENFDFANYQICNNNLGNRLVADSELDQSLTIDPKLGNLTGLFADVALSDIQEDQVFEQLLISYITLLNEISFEPNRDTMESQLMKRYDNKAKWKYTRHMYTET